MAEDFKKIIEGLKKGKVLYSMKEDFQSIVFAYKDGRFSRFITRSGHMNAVAFISEDRVKMLLGNFMEKPTEKNLEEPDKRLKELMDTYVFLDEKGFLKLYERGELKVGGGMTTDTSFTVDASESESRNLDYIRRVLSEKSSGYFTFNSYT